MQCGAAGFPVFPEPAVLDPGQDDELTVRSVYVVSGVAGGADPNVSPAKRAGGMEDAPDG